MCENMDTEDKDIGMYVSVMLWSEFIKRESNFWRAKRAVG
jgi:hypothetical protein